MQSFKKIGRKIVQLFYSSLLEQGCRSFHFRNQSHFTAKSGHHFNKNILLLKIFIILFIFAFIYSGFITLSLHKFGVKLKISGHFGSNQKFGLILGQISNFIKSRQIIYQNNAFGVSFSKKVVLRSSEVSQGHKSRKKSQISKFNEIIWSFLK